MSAVPPMVVTIASEGRDVAEVGRHWIVTCDRPPTRWRDEDAAQKAAAFLRADGAKLVEVRVVVECIVAEIPAGHALSEGEAWVRSHLAPLGSEDE